MRIVRRVDGIHEKGQRTCREGQLGQIWKVLGTYRQDLNSATSWRGRGPGCLGVCEVLMFGEQAIRRAQQAGWVEWDKPVLG